MANDNVLAALAGGFQGASNVTGKWVDYLIAKKLKDQDLVGQQALLKQKQQGDLINPQELPRGVRDLIGLDETAQNPINEKALKFYEPQFVYNPTTQTYDQVSPFKSKVAPMPKANPQMITQSEFTKRRAAGETMNASEYKVIPDNNGTTAGVRGQIGFLHNLPSNMSPSTATGAAAQVLLAARQGKALIAKPGSPQELALSSADLARAVQRSSPQLETLRGADFTSNLQTKLATFQQKITSDPTSPDVAKLRKQIFDIFDELEQSASPAVERQLQNLESTMKNQLPPNWKELRAGELGQNMAPILFQETANAPSVSGIGSQSQISLVGDKAKRLQELRAKQAQGTLK